MLKESEEQKQPLTDKADQGQEYLTLKCRNRLTGISPSSVTRSVGSSPETKTIFNFVHTEIASLSSLFIVRKVKGGRAEVFSNKKKVAEIAKEGKTFRLVNHKDKVEWLLTNRVHGEARPMSYSVIDPKHTTKIDMPENEVFVVRDQIFQHNGRFYMLANHPEGKLWDEHVDSKVRYIGRLDHFPYSSLLDADYGHRDLRGKIKRLRGVPVGEASGLGIDESGHKVRLDNELHDVGLFIAAISYLLFASA